MWKKALLQYNAVDFGVHKYAKTKDVVLHSIIQQSITQYNPAKYV